MKNIILSETEELPMIIEPIKWEIDSDNKIIK